MDSFVSSLPPVTWSNLSSHLSSKTRSHLTRVYGHLVTLLGVSSVASYAFLTYARSVPLLDSPWLSLLGTLGCALSFHLTSPVKENDSKRYAFSMGFAVFQVSSVAKLGKLHLHA